MAERRIEGLAAARLWATDRFPYLATGLFGAEVVAVPDSGTVSVDEGWRMRADPDLVAGWTAAAGLAGWAGMSVSFLPALRLYRLGWWRAPVLPLVAGLYALMTADSARRHYAGRGGEWKGRTVAAPRGQGVINRP